MKIIKERLPLRSESVMTELLFLPLLTLLLMIHFKNLTPPLDSDSESESVVVVVTFRLAVRWYDFLLLLFLEFLTLLTLPRSFPDDSDLTFPPSFS